MIDFSSSFVQPVLGHSAQPTGKNQLTKGDSGVMPRKTEEADSFEKQPQPPANRVEKNTVVPTVVATAILSPLLGALVGEGAWQGLASDETQSVNVPVEPSPPQQPCVEDAVRTPSHAVINECPPGLRCARCERRRCVPRSRHWLSVHEWQ